MKATLSLSFPCFSSAYAQEKRSCFAEIIVPQCQCHCSQCGQQYRTNQYHYRWEGEFEIPAKINDELIFSSVEFRIKTLSVTPDIIGTQSFEWSVNERR